MKRKHSKLLCLDFDGVLHSYTSGWKGADVIPDPPVRGALEFVTDALKHFDVCVYSTRSGRPGGIEAMRAWMERWGFPKVEFPTEKPPAFISIDDRAYRYNGGPFPDPQVLKGLESWVKTTASST